MTLLYCISLCNPFMIIRLYYKHKLIKNIPFLLTLVRINRWSIEGHLHITFTSEQSRECFHCLRIYIWTLQKEIEKRIYACFLCNLLCYRYTCFNINRQKHTYHWLSHIWIACKCRDTVKITSLSIHARLWRVWGEIGWF